MRGTVSQVSEMRTGEPDLEVRFTRPQKRDLWHPRSFDGMEAGPSTPLKYASLRMTAVVTGRVLGEGSC